MCRVSCEVGLWGLLVGWFEGLGVWRVGVAEGIVVRLVWGVGRGLVLAPVSRCPGVCLLPEGAVACPACDCIGMRGVVGVVDGEVVGCVGWAVGGAWAPGSDGCPPFCEDGGGGVVPLPGLMPFVLLAACRACGEVGAAGL